MVEKPKFKVEKKLWRPRVLHTAYHIHDQLLRAPLLIGGFYNWHRVLSGEFELHGNRAGTLKDYDIIFLGMSKPELEGMMISEIRKEIGDNSNTLIVACVDYAIEIWGSTFNIKQLKDELEKADIVFTGEPKMRNQLEALINKPVKFLTHPTNTAILKEKAQPYESRQNAVLCLIHRYNNDWVPPWLVVKDFKDIMDYAVFLDGHPNNLVTKMPFFRQVRPGVDYDPWIEFLKQAKIVVDSYHNMHTYGRGIVDAACLKVPVIGTNIVYAQAQLFPKLTTEPNDILHQRELLAQLKGDRKFYEEVAEYAYEAVDMFSYQDSLENFKNMVEAHQNAKSNSRE
jgi:hypothetical protein